MTCKIILGSMPYQSIEGLSHLPDASETREYEGVKFENCSLSQTSFENIIFNDCLFDNCDLSLINLMGTAFRKVKFVRCKLVGCHFEEMNSMLFAATFMACDLSLSSFFQVHMEKCRFEQCIMKECDLSEIKASGVDFLRCDFALATFDHSDLTNANFTGSSAFDLNPQINKISGLTVDRDQIFGLIRHLGIKIN